MRHLKHAALAILSFLFTVSCQTDPNPGEQKFFVARAYDSKTLQAELDHLSLIDVSKLTDIEREAVAVRQQELKLAKDALALNPNIMINVGRCLPEGPRIPPGPCPFLEDVTERVPVSTNIELDLVGVYMDVPEVPGARLAQDQAGIVITTPDGKKIFAEGTLNSYDDLFRTAWYQFTMKNRALAGKELLAKIQTIVIFNGQSQVITMERTIPPNFFKAK